MEDSLSLLKELIQLPGLSGYEEPVQQRVRTEWEPLTDDIRAGRIGSLAARFHGVPTEYSQRRTIEQDGPEILRRCREDEVDAALLVPL